MKKALILAALLASTSAQAFDAAKTRVSVDQVLNKAYPDLDALYKDIHAHPELGYQETRTAAKLAGLMREMGFQVTEGVNKTGIVAVYKNGPGPLILVRTELDALPLQEKTGLPYASQVKTQWNGTEVYVDHACGHDVHMAAWIGTARTLLALKSQWHGTLMFIGQPAEEVEHGAKGMLEEGLYARFGKPDYALALHDSPDVAGDISYLAGPISSNADELEINFKGRGGHGSMPNATIDPILIASRFVVDVQSVISREKNPFAFGVVTVGAFQAGSAGNIIPDHAFLRGTVRTYDQGVRARIGDGIRRIALAGARDFPAALWQRGDQRRRPDRPDRQGVQGGLRRPGASLPRPRHRQRGLLGIQDRGRADPHVHRRRHRSEGGRGRQGRRPARAGQSLALLRAAAGADHQGCGGGNEPRRHQPHIEVRVSAPPAPPRDRGDQARDRARPCRSGWLRCRRTSPGSPVCSRGPQGPPWSQPAAASGVR